MVCYPNLKQWKQWCTTLCWCFPRSMKRHLTSRERIVWRSYGSRQSVAARSIIQKFLKSPQHGPSLKEWLMGLLWALRLASISWRFNSTRKWKKSTKKSFLKTVNHHREGIHTSFKGPVIIYVEGGGGGRGADQGYFRLARGGANNFFIKKFREVSSLIARYILREVHWPKWVKQLNSTAQTK